MKRLADALHATLVSRLTAAGWVTPEEHAYLATTLQRTLAECEELHALAEDLRRERDAARVELMKFRAAWAFGAPASVATNKEGT